MTSTRSTLREMYAILQSDPMSGICAMRLPNLRFGTRTTRQCRNAVRVTGGVFDMAKPWQIINVDVLLDSTSGELLDCKCTCGTQYDCIHVPAFLCQDQVDEMPPNCAPYNDKLLKDLTKAEEDRAFFAVSKPGLKRYCNVPFCDGDGFCGVTKKDPMWIDPSANLENDPEDDNPMLELLDIRNNNRTENIRWTKLIVSDDLRLSFTLNSPDSVQCKQLVDDADEGVVVPEPNIRNSEVERAKNIIGTHLWNEYQQAVNYFVEDDVEMKFLLDKTITADKSAEDKPVVTELKALYSGPVFEQVMGFFENDTWPEFEADLMDFQ